MARKASAKPHAATIKRAPRPKKEAKVFEDQDERRGGLHDVRLHLSANLKLPTDVAVRKISWIGKSGSGKSHGVGLMLEQMRKCGIRFIVLDPVGTHTGIAQLDGVVFHEVQRGMHVGRFVQHVLQNDLNIVVNMRALSFDQQRVFIALFLENLYRHNKDYGPRHLVVEEVQQFAPQGGKAESKEMLQVLSTMGRMEGIGLSVVTQRPAIVDKTVIANTDLFMFFQLMLPQDLGAVEEVLTARTNLPPEEEAKIDGMISSMPTLHKGEAIAYSPEWLMLAEKRKVDAKRVTPHTGQTPDNYVRPMGDEPGLGGPVFQDGDPTGGSKPSGELAGPGAPIAAPQLAGPGGSPPATPLDSPPLAPRPPEDKNSLSPSPPRISPDPAGPSAAPVLDAEATVEGPLVRLVPPQPAKPPVRPWKVAVLVGAGLLAFPAVFIALRAIERGFRSSPAPAGAPA